MDALDLCCWIDGSLLCWVESNSLCQAVMVVRSQLMTDVVTTYKGFKSEMREKFSRKTGTDGDDCLNFWRGPDRRDGGLGLCLALFYCSGICESALECL